MSEIRFSCPECRRRLTADGERAGEKIPCKGCGVMVPVPFDEGIEDNTVRTNAPAVPSTERAGASAATDMKSCPMCGQSIRAEARRCRYCGESLDESDAHDTLEQPHRGPLLLTLACVSFFPCLLGLCGMAGSVLSIVVLILAHQDLQAMSEDRMDRSGKGLTRAAQIIAWIQIVLVGLAILFYAVFIGFFVFQAANGQLD